MDEPLSKQSVTILGATGSIGLSTLDVIRRHPDRFVVDTLTARNNSTRMLELCHQFAPATVVMAEEQAAEQLSHELVTAGLGDIEVRAGSAAIEEAAAADSSSCVMAAIVGAAGLLPTLAAARAGKRVLLANKESLVMSGALFMDEVTRSGADLLPIDSEHNAVFQCLPSDHRQGLTRSGVDQVILTASGGPFLDRPLETLATVTPAEACRHPNWVMGRKISVDSATMMNKGLELIEAHWLFAARSDQIDILIHPQSVVHSMVRYVDGSILAQLGNPDMRTPIAYALAWPTRVNAGVAALDLAAVAQLDFREPDPGRFPCLRLCREALESGGSACAVLSAANEVAVQAFLDERLAFSNIVRVIEQVMDRMPIVHDLDLEKILDSDREARHCAALLVDQHERRLWS